MGHTTKLVLQRIKVVFYEGGLCKVYTVILSE